MLVIDPKREHIAVREACTAGVPVIAVLDTDCDPSNITVPIPANDDALRSVEILLVKLVDAVLQGKEESASYVAPPSEAAGGRKGIAAASFGGDEDRRGRGRRGGPGGGRGRGQSRGGRRTSGASQHQVREKVRGQGESKPAADNSASGSTPPAPPREDRSAPAPDSKKAEPESAEEKKD
jgi:small subunit ribosomal protein S2